MKHLLTFVLSWLIAGFGAVVGSIVGHGAGQQGLFLGAILGGALGVVAAVFLSRRFAWLERSETRGALVGGLSGLAIAIPLTLSHLHNPVVPVLSCGLVGVGVLLGATIARRRSAP